MEIKKKKRRKNLAAKGAKAKGVEETAAANLAGIGDALAGTLLWSLIQKDNLGTVYDVCLHPGNVDELGHLRYPYHIVV